ncbi:squalene/phytoene synthase family protein [Streptomyces oryzae]|uniref:Squalene/phytoene synthase family protein n=1 Tax=Streptomyces oryzae TaxID=1434886 RepID=A0ABS3X8F7_9ACTN|nr:squalene/phytoene synthase family protein [Streptomyces oryzae]MBO8191628.1 squalene/phytoene synthase family protein [Streptomyces oryzae]
MLARRWLDAAGITDPVLRHGYTECVRELAGADGGTARWQGLRSAPAAARPHTAALLAHGCRADLCVDSGPVDDRQRRFTQFVEATWAAFAAGGSHDPVLHATVHTYQAFGIPLSVVEDMFTAMQRDLDFRDFATFEELRQWCMQMTGGSMAMIYRVMGAATEPADELLVREFSVFAQLTDVLRDLSEDLDDGRLYLPLEDLDRFNVRAEDLKAKRWTPAMADLVAFEAERVTEQLHQTAAAVHGPLSALWHTHCEHAALLIAAVLAAGPDVLHQPVQPPLGTLLNVWRSRMRAVIPC